MSNYLTESPSLNAGNIFYVPAEYTSASQSQERRCVQDSIQFREEQQSVKSDAAAQSAASCGRVALPEPSGTTAPNSLQLLTAAFIAAFTAMNNSVITQTNDYAQMQQLEETQTQSVLQSTTDAINKQNAAAQESAQIANYEKSTAKDESVIGKLMFFLGLTFMVVTFLSGFVDCGASDAALPEEVEMVDLAADSDGDNSDAADGVDLNSPSSDNSAVESDAEDENNTEESKASMKSLQDMMSKPTTALDSAEEDTEKTVTRDLDKTSQEASKSKSSWRNSKFWRFGKFALKLTMGAAFASPMLMRGLVSLNISGQLDQLASAQKSVGEALSLMQTNNMYYQFLQQLVQREGSVLQEETESASQVVETYADITNAYQGINYGLAQAV